MTDVHSHTDDPTLDPTQLVFDAKQAAGELFTMLSQQVSSGAMPMDVGSVFGAQGSDQAPDFTQMIARYETMPLQLADGTGDEVTITPSPGTPAKKGSLAWGGYQNGRIPKAALVPVKVGKATHHFEPKAATDFQRMVAAAAAEGVTITLTDSYRDYDAQVSVRARKGGKVATATPGTSVHGWGRAIDVNLKADPNAFNWLRSNGAKFGWHWPAWAQRKGKSYEEWHWEHYG